MANNSSSPVNVGDVGTLAYCVSMETGMYIWGIGSIICCAAGLPANFVILWEMFKAYRDGAALTSYNLFLLNLSSMDTIFLLFLPVAIINHFKFNIWLLNAFSSATYTLNICGRPLLMACICLDLYVAVVHPIFYRRMKSLTPRAVGVAVVWFVTLITAGFYFSFNKLYFTLFSTLYFIAAMVIIGICDAFILYVLIASGRSGRGVHPQKQRAIQTLTNSLVMTFLSYFPPVVLFIFGLHLMSDSRVFICTIGLPITLTSTWGSAVMPMLHLNDLGKFNCLWVRCAQ
ncbi:G-protein coupled receptor 42-like [Phyllopteryx taeniolatus]|uniref:G-protein coupled receptor 42-like n=1 Tax=Phyllopteryx taeniolatus TaxID=161469 RepID=UPI002AD4069F|nr:G-protein coupled receptor 42-like [Phyllopteryx taeniolatus]